MADYDSSGKIPVLKTSFRLSAITGARQGSTRRSRAVGIGSRRKVALEDVMIIMKISERVVRRKRSIFDIGGLSGRLTGGQRKSSMEFLTFRITI